VLQSLLHRIWKQIKFLPCHQSLCYAIEVSIPLIAGFASGQMRYGVVALIGSMYVGLVARIAYPDLWWRN
jgi:hypothetical protein